jgi:hypothetical protein
MMSVPEININISGIAHELGWAGIPMEAARVLAGHIVQLQQDYAALEARIQALESAARNTAPYLAHVEKRTVPAPMRP